MRTATAGVSISEKPFKNRSALPVQNMKEVATIILAGGEGKRLQPLTLNRSKPALPFGGSFFLVDIPISHSLAAGCTKTFVITQFFSSSINRHIEQTYNHHLKHTEEGIEILSAEMRPSRQSWFQGTADAVRQNLEYILRSDANFFLILAGDQLYNFDFKPMLQLAKEKEADLVIAALPVDAMAASQLGILKVDDDSNIIDFFEKPGEKALLQKLKTAAQLFSKAGLSREGNKNYLGSMGIYLFKRSALIQLLKEDLREDFGKHLIPTQIVKGKTFAFLYDGYWEDIGTIEAFYKANMSLTEHEPAYDLYCHSNALFKSTHKLPSSKICKTLVEQSIICDGCLIEAAAISHSIIGQRSIIGCGTEIKNSYLMGNDYYETRIKDLKQHPEKPSIGKNCLIEKAIIDRNVCIGDNVQLVNKKGLKEFQDGYIHVKEGIIIVPEGTTIPNKYKF